MERSRCQRDFITFASLSASARAERGNQRRRCSPAVPLMRLLAGSLPPTRKGFQRKLSLLTAFPGNWHVLGGCLGNPGFLQGVIQRQGRAGCGRCNGHCLLWPHKEERLGSCGDRAKQNLLKPAPPGLEGGKGSSCWSINRGDPISCHVCL